MPERLVAGVRTVLEGGDVEVEFAVWVEGGAVRAGAGARGGEDGFGGREDVGWWEEVGGGPAAEEVDLFF